MTDDWWRHASIYQIYPRSFADSDGDGLGDIPGITVHVPDLARLGVDAIWLTPFYPSPLADGGYDVADFRGVDPRLGTLADFDALIAAAHEAGIKVMVDVVPNHTSSAHAWFQEALAAPRGSVARNRYVFREGRGAHGEQPPTNWLSNFGGPAWTRVPDGQWYLHNFAPEQPDLNWDDPEVRADFRATFRFWSDRGVDGFRIDVAHGMAKDLREPLRDVDHPEVVDALEALKGQPDHPIWDRPEVHDIFREWHQVFDEYDPPRMAVGETWVPAASRALYTRPDELSQAFNFEFVLSGWSARAYREVIDAAIASAEGEGTVATWVLSNHDVVRDATRYGLPDGIDFAQWVAGRGQTPPVDAELGLRRARAAALLSLGLPGSAYVYQGEELGLPEVYDLPDEVLQDPIYQRTGHRLRGRDGCRVPLPWTASGPSLGFGPGPGWLPQPASFAGLSVEAQAGDPGSTLALYTEALDLRAKWLDDERLVWEPGFDEDHVLAFRRGTNDVLVVINLGREPVALPAGQVLVSSVPVEGRVLPGNAAVWLKTR